MRINQILTLLFMLLFMPLKAKECGVINTAGYIREFKANYSELLSSDELEEWADLASLILASGEQALSSFQKDFKANELLSADQVRAKLAEIRTLTASFDKYRDEVVKRIRSNQDAVVMAIESVPDQETTDFSIDDLCRMAERLINVGLALDQSYLLDPDLLHVDPEFRDRLWHDCTSFEDLTVIDPFGVLPEMFKFLKNSAFEKDKNKHFRITRMRLYKMRGRFSSYNSGKGKYQFIYHNCKPNDFKKLLFPGTVGGNLVDGMNKTDFQQCFMVWCISIIDIYKRADAYRFLDEEKHKFYINFYNKIVALEGFYGDQSLSNDYFNTLEKVLYNRLLEDLKSSELFTDVKTKRSDRTKQFNRVMYETNGAEYLDLKPSMSEYFEQIIDATPEDEIISLSNYYNVMYALPRLKGFMLNDFRFSKEQADLKSKYDSIHKELYRSMKDNDLARCASFTSTVQMKSFSQCEKAILQFVFYSVNSKNYFFGDETVKNGSGNPFQDWLRLREDPILVSLYYQAVYEMQVALGFNPVEAKCHFTKGDYFRKIDEKQVN